MHSLTTSHVERTPAEARTRPGRVLDEIAIGLVLLTGVWMAWAATGSGGSPVPGIQLLLACGLVLIAARIIGSRSRLVVPAAALVAAVIVAVRSRTGVLSTAPLSGPLEYINADAAFYVQAAIAGLMVAVVGRSWPLRMIGVMGAVAFAALPFVLQVAAASTLIVILPGIALVAGAVAGAKGLRACVAILGVLFVATVAATIVAGSSYSATTEPSRLQRLASRVIDHDRLVLWHDSFVIMRDHPGTGVGPRRYQVVSPVARQNRDYRWAHNEFLQQGAEGGIAGLVLLVGIFVWGFGRLWVVRGLGATTILGAVALAALGIHASADYVMHFPAIPIMAAGLIATGMADDGRSHSSR